MEYDLKQLGDPKKFQRLVNAILTARFGEDARLTPIQGTDGGSDGETATDNPHMEFQYLAPSLSPDPLVAPPRPGRYLFQAKYHRTGEQRIADLRTLVIREFRDALDKTILRRPDRQDVNYFFLVTNISASENALRRVDDVRTELLADHRHLHADIWWGERITASLDWAPDLWHSFPELFPGRTPPLLAKATRQTTDRLSRTLRLAVGRQHTRDRKVKFRQIELEQQLLDLFVDLDVSLSFSDPLLGSRPSKPIRRYWQGRLGAHHSPFAPFGHARPLSALELLISDDPGVPRILLEGGPGQGKSTVTQMAAQIYREKLLGIQESAEREPAWQRRARLRLPIRIELRHFAQWESREDDGSLEQFIAREIRRDSGGSSVAVEDIHALVERSPVILFLDGLDEIGNDASRDRCLDAIMETIQSFDETLKADLRVVLTTRPPAVAGRWNKLEGFARAVLMPMNPRRIDEYLDRWLSAQIHDEVERGEEEQQRIRESFDHRRHDPHVDALARNPMQLSVLLQFIYLKGQAFPDRRAELYRDYFQIVIDRDVEKSPELRRDRDVVEGLHSFLGFHIHGMTEVEQGGRSLNRREILRLAGAWLQTEGQSGDLAERYFALGEERFGLIVARSGEAEETTYGFEVQPIQEYFAAAYISNRITNADAHEVFGLLIDRSYWREVALFFAGLRRHNERADLVGRAKSADEKLCQGVARHNGKAMVLQLLWEGVLTQPGHVLREAMDFVMDLLDPTALRVQMAPHATVGMLSDLCRRYGNDAIRNRIAEAAKLLSESNDYHLIALVHGLAANVLGEDEYGEIVLGYSGNVRKARSAVRVACPYGHGGNVLGKLARREGYWNGIGMATVARDVWRGASRDGAVRDFEYPRGLHLHLLVQWAIGQWGDGGGVEQVLKVGESLVPAVWGLKRNVQQIATWAASHEDGQGGRCEEERDVETPQLSWSNGKGELLPEDVVDCVRDLIHSSAGLIDALSGDDENVIVRRGTAYARAINDHLQDLGLASWIACRCASEFVQRGRIEIWHRYGMAGDAINEMIDKMVGLYDLGTDSNVRRWHADDLFLFGTPLGLRVEAGSSPVRLEEVIGDALRGELGGDARDMGWLDSVPVPRALLVPLVEMFRTDLPVVLGAVGERGVTGVLSGRRLKVQDVQRILKICRGTDEARFLGGAAEVMTCATFAKIAETELVGKMVAAAPSSMLVRRVLYTSRQAGGRREVTKAERKLGERVARVVVERPDRFPFRVVNQATMFLADRERMGARPLFDEHPGLWNTTGRGDVGG